MMTILFDKMRRWVKCLLMFYLFTFLPLTANASLPVIDKDIAHRMGTINVLYNNRICPLNTVTTDFVTKLTGSASWNGYSADEIFTSWMIYYSPWEQQKLIRVKSREVQHLLGIDSQWASYSDFINEYHEYKLQDIVFSVHSGSATVTVSDRKDLLEADEKYHLIEMFYRGQFIRMFPYSIPPNDQTTNLPNDQVTWYSPGAQTLPREIPVNEQFFIKQAMDFLTESIVTGQRDRAFEIIAKIKLFQSEMIGDVLPSESKTRAEIFYNTLRSQRWPVFLALTLSLLLCIAMLFTRKRIIHFSLFTFTFLLFAYVTLQLGLRWWLGGHLPVSNGPETMLFMAWVLLLLPVALGAKAILMRKRILHSSFFTLHLSMCFGPLMASFCLLVAMLGGTSSQLTPLMPVLQSPLLSVHVMTVMCAYALFALQMLIGVYALIVRSIECRTESVEFATAPEPTAVANSKLYTLNSKLNDAEANSKLYTLHSKLERVTALSQLMLYPAVFLLAIGIFLGAVWANVSWGCYWSWDPKESWALITLMVYAVPLHKGSVGIFNKPRFYHLYIVSAFLTVLITYFGVNFLLGGMHSYA